ncbi:MAG: hypothetical protein JNL70_27675 [Saprospiraceae bacterium]|nr:hypothetical protein [Saprospiraceae bacterium]
MMKMQNNLGFRRRFLRLFMSLLALSLVHIAHARYPGELVKGAKSDPSVVTSRSDCNPGKSRYDMQLNNVRATLLSSGDVWWDLDNPGYVIPKVQPGTGAKAVSSIFAGAVWLGGKDPSGNLKVACQTYRTGNPPKTDFWPGPLNENGQTNKATCDNWDKHFIVFRNDIDSCIRLFRAAKDKDPNNPIVDPGLIPESVKGWPANGNPYFFEIHRFTLPRTRAGLGKFHDEDGDLTYDPTKGDYPTIDIKGCDIDVYPDEMVFWVYNDNGNVHTNSLRSIPIQMEVQVQAFSYQTNDELNDMTFQRYKLINRAKTDIDSMYFAMWTDPDLGCYQDDYIGCDTTRSLMYIYNEDATDGITGCECAGTNTYCDKIPLLGVDYFRGPNDENGKELGMSSFTYYLNGGVTGCPAQGGTTDPNTAIEYYNYLTGFWRDGTPYTFGGSGYNPNSTSKRLKYAFVDAPNNPAGWSMATAGLPCGDRRTIQASGPLKLKPGAINELIIGVPWVADVDHPSPDIRKLQEADDIAQALFNACFKIFDGPDAPDMTFVELDREIIAVLTNAPFPQSNNAGELYKEAGLRIPRQGNTDTNYFFQGYKLYQLHDGDVGVADLDNPEKSRLVYQVDIQDDISKIFNWSQQPDPNFPGRTINTPILKVDGENKGIRHTFSIKEDKFATGDDRRLVNHKKYYFLTVAYAYNNYVKFDGLGNLGQRDPYVVGRRNIGDKLRGNKAYEVLPRPIVDVKLGSSYGEGAIVTRLDGVGSGGNFLDISEGTLAAILAGTKDGTVTYKSGRAPIEVKVVNPLEVVDGTYTLQIKDKDLTDDVVNDTARWELRREGESSVIVSERTIAKLNEQIIAKYGFSISVRQTAEPGTQATTDKTNGAVGYEITYKKPGLNWLTGVPDDAAWLGGIPIFNYLKTGTDLEPDFNLDPKQALSKIANYTFVPYALCDHRIESPENQPLVTPAWQRPSNSSVRNNGLARLNNVDIVFTSDKSKWSRCVVIETASPYYYDPTYRTGVNLPTVGNAKNFNLRGSPSVGKDADASNPNKPVGQVLPDEQSAGIVNGMGWFPGYAIDVETGERLNIFFGENSTFDPSIGDNYGESRGINRDMLFNPSDLTFLNVGSATPSPATWAYNAFMGGQHMVYVTNTPYDNCLELRSRLNGASDFPKITALSKVTWAGMIFTTPGQKLLSYKDGLIPNDVTVKLRVNNPYNPLKGKGTNGNHPAYQFKLESKAPKTLANTTQIDSSLNMINVAPNPYYGYSAYEINELSTTVKITNLPPKSVVTVYTLDGRFIRQFKRDERASENSQSQNLGTRYKQYAPDLEWDMKNEKGIPVASGVYLIHIAAEGLGERTLKFFAINRQFDPSRL